VFFDGGSELTERKQKAGGTDWRREKESKKWKELTRTEKRK
jgi:hypothetical protein